MLYLDVKYANIIGARLKNFKQKKDYLWNYSCPVCGDSTKNKLKARGFVYRVQSDLFVKCHNCGYGTYLSNFIKYVDPIIYEEYIFEKYKSNFDHNKEVPEPLSKESNSVILLEDDILSSITRIDKLRESHPAVKYLIKRQIPRNVWYLLYFAPKFKKYTNSIKYTFESLEGDHPRMIIPFFDDFGRVIMFQGRSYDDKLQRYITIRLDETSNKIYGLERIDYSKRIKVLEGPIDSLMLSNAIAVAGSSLDKLNLKSSNVVYIFDNEPRNKQVMRIMKNVIESGKEVFIWPKTILEKDINDAYISGYDMESIIEQNTYSGLSAQLEFSNWVIK